MAMVEVKLVGVRVEIPSSTPVVVLASLDERQTLSIFIGAPEATAIALALEGVETPRPLTHDLMVDVFDNLGVTLTQVVVSELRETTFFAELHLSGAAGGQLVSCRPSDAIALAARVGCPIFVDDEVMAEAGVESEPPEPTVAEIDAEELEEFRQFIETLNPDDFET
jgi:bifunctional DNase/RNase